jgi:DNA-3-methyladenine glycosylase
MRATALPRSFFARPAPEVAPELMNKLFVVGRAVGRIVEVEAYTQDDPASHSFRGPSARNKVMFGPPGFLYVYFVYGSHFCANVVTGAEHEGEAVLIRALAPVANVDEMRARRPGVSRDVDLMNGPGKLTRALGIGRDNNGADLCSPASRIRLADDGTPAPLFPDQSARIGISVGLDRRWRFYLAGDPHVSPRRPAGALIASDS